MHRLILFALILIISGPVHAEVVGESVDYRSGDTVFKGFIAYDDSFEDERPGILVVHEWWGHNDYVRKRARMLAELGYVALAVDMYGAGKQADHPDEAGKFAAAVMEDLPEAKDRFLAAMDVLKQHRYTDPGQIAAVGYCFGGGVVLQMARMGVDLDAVVSFHGSLGTTRPAEPGDVEARVLVLHGAADPLVPADQVEQFKQEMENANVDYRFIAYPGAMHAFTNPDADKYGEKFDLPLKYSAVADRASWIDMQNFLLDVFD